VITSYLRQYHNSYQIVRHDIPKVYFLL